MLEIPFFFFLFEGVKALKTNGELERPSRKHQCLTNWPEAAFHSPSRHII